MSWIDSAKLLPIGTKERHYCVNACGTDQSMLVCSSVKGWSAYCFRCGNIGFYDRGYMTLTELKELRDAEESASASARAGVLSLPSDTTYLQEEWSPEARLWLYKANIYGELLTKYSIGYSPSLRRVVLPVRRGDNLRYYQLRDITGKNTKYINPSVDKSRLLFQSITKHFTPSTLPRRACIITEDILSAIRAGEFLPAYSPLGTKLSTQQIAQLLTYDYIFIWLDPDQAGITGALTMRKQLSLTSEVIIVESEVDPKLLSNKQIQDTLEKAYVNRI